MSEQSLSTDEEKIARQILEYMKDHPKAKDTIEGISQWWIPNSSKKTVAKVERAVSRLLSDGLIVTTQRKGSPHCFAVNPHKLEEISKILKVPEPQ